MTAVETLQVLNYNLKVSLSRETPVGVACHSVVLSSVLPSALQNVAQALLVLKDLQEVQCTSADLQQVPDLVATLRKVGQCVPRASSGRGGCSLPLQVRRYTASEVVMKRAEEVYRKLKSLFLHLGKPAARLVGGARRQGARVKHVGGVKKPLSAVRRVERGGKAPSIGRRKPAAAAAGSQSRPRAREKPAPSQPQDAMTVPEVIPPRRSARDRGKVVDYREAGPEDEQEEEGRAQDQTVPC